MEYGAGVVEEMINHEVITRINCGMEKFEEATRIVVTQLQQVTALFEDRDKWYATQEGQWPDRFILLNRFVRTGLRPPFIFND